MIGSLVKCQCLFCLVKLKKNKNKNFFKQKKNFPLSFINFSLKFQSTIYHRSFFSRLCCCPSIHHQITIIIFGYLQFSSFIHLLCVCVWVYVSCFFFWFIFIIISHIYELYLNKKLSMIIIIIIMAIFLHSFIQYCWMKKHNPFY